MMAYDRFDVLKVLFPFIDLPIRKPRPVLVASPATFNAANGHVVVAMITTGAGSHWPSVLSHLESPRPRPEPSFCHSMEAVHDRQRAGRSANRSALACGSLRVRIAP
ncbi:type II toxin-antitoxin system PemK/MazF family toxin [uncultured Methylobacterium sp.]|uniref:type II toxin-antitoxin system PemK/MazF family toxin n=1 Tax=uncultured Methylobacterium sp. TaxID=157278 RepID=UPI0035CB6A1D